MSNDKREELEQRIADAEARKASREQALVAPVDMIEGEVLQEDEGDDSHGSFSERARDTGNKFAGFAREHPFALVGGALAVGAAISLALPNSPTRKAAVRLGKAAAPKSLAARAVATDLAVMFGKHLFDAYGQASQAGKDTLDKADSIARHARDAAVKTAKEAGRKAVRARRKRSD